MYFYKLQLVQGSSLYIALQVFIMFRHLSEFPNIFAQLRMRLTTSLVYRIDDTIYDTYRRYIDPIHGNVSRYVSYHLFNKNISETVIFFY